MPLLQVRECPEDIYQKVILFAKMQKRTIGQQVVILLEKALGQEESNRDRRRRLLAAVKNRSISEKVREVDASALIREDRDR